MLASGSSSADPQTLVSGSSNTGSHTHHSRSGSSTSSYTAAEQSGGVAGVQSDDGTSKVPVIAASVGAAVLALVIGLLLLCFCRRRRKRRAAANDWPTTFSSDWRRRERIPDSDDGASRMSWSNRSLSTLGDSDLRSVRTLDSIPEGFAVTNPFADPRPSDAASVRTLSTIQTTDGRSSSAGSSTHASSAGTGTRRSMISTEAPSYLTGDDAHFMKHRSGATSTSSFFAAPSPPPRARWPFTKGRRNFLRPPTEARKKARQASPTPSGLMTDVASCSATLGSRGTSRNLGRTQSGGSSSSPDVGAPESAVTNTTDGSTSMSAAHASLLSHQMFVAQMSGASVPVIREWPVSDTGHAKGREGSVKSQGSGSDVSESMFWRKREV